MMQAGKGSIITISSIRGLLGNPIRFLLCFKRRNGTFDQTNGA